MIVKFKVAYEEYVVGQEADISDELAKELELKEIVLTLRESESKVKPEVVEEIVVEEEKPEVIEEIVEEEKPY